MQDQTPYHETERLYNAIAARLGPNGGADARSPLLANIPINDTEFAACLVTLGIPLRYPAPYTDCNQDDGNRIRTWWLAHDSPSGHKTEDLLEGYYQRERMEKEHPLHPLNPMRAAIDARNFWLRVIKHEERLPIEAQGYLTGSLREASILLAHNYKALAFTGRAFILESEREGAQAGMILDLSMRPEGATAPQWMSKVLLNLDELLRHIKRSGSTVIRITDGPRSMLLSTEATPKTVAKFENLL